VIIDWQFAGERYVDGKTSTDIFASLKQTNEMLKRVSRELGIQLHMLHIAAQSPA
jgi:hypothetical protein